MNIYEKLKELPVFRMQDVDKYYHNIGSARSAVKRLMARDQVRKIRSNLYTCHGEEWDGSAADKFQIASAITETACVSHLSAMEYHGFTDQYFEDVYVSSDARFSDFAFDGNRFHYLQTRIKEGVDEPRFRGGVRVTDPERTLVDCLKDLDKISRLSDISGPETMLSIFMEMGTLNEDLLLRYLALYDNQFLYQKAGFLLQLHRRNAGLSKEFFDVCRAHIGKSKRYLTGAGSTSDINLDTPADNPEKKTKNAARNTDSVYNSEWKLVVPASIAQLV